MSPAGQAESRHPSLKLSSSCTLVAPAGDQGDALERLPGQVRGPGLRLRVIGRVDLPVLSHQHPADGANRPHHGGLLPQPGVRGQAGVPGERGARALRGLVRGARAEDPQLWPHVGLLPAAQGGPDEAAGP